MKTEDLKQLANRLRFTAVDMIYKGKDGHPGSALSIADILISCGSIRKIRTGRIGIA